MIKIIIRLGVLIFNLETKGQINPLMKELTDLIGLQDISHFKDKFFGRLGPNG